MVFRGFLFLLASLSGVFTPGTTLAASTAAEVEAKCKNGSLPVRSPQEVFRRRGLSFDNACPTQTRFDKKHECQDVALSLGDIFDTLKEDRPRLCAAAEEAVRQSQRECRDQEACLQAQRDANQRFQTLLAEQIRNLDKYSSLVDDMLKYATDAIAGGGVELLRYVKNDIQSNPNGLGGTARWLQARSNQSALRDVFRNEDERKASAVIEKFRNHQGSESDIAGIRSDVIREPLRVVLSGQEWKSELQAYRKGLEGTSAALAKQQTQLNTRQRTMASATENGPGAPKSSLSGGAIDGLSNAMRAASAAAPLLASQAGSPSGEITAPSTGREPGFGASPDPAIRESGSGTAASAPNDAGSTEKQSIQNGDLAFGAAPVGSGGTLAGALRDALHSSGPSSGTGASKASSPARGKAQGGGGAPLAGREGPGGAAKAAAGEVAAQEGAGIYPGGGILSSGSGASPLQMPSVPTESNEKAVQGIVGDWERSLHPEGAGDSSTLASAEGILSGETASLFERVSGAHQRAQKRGGVRRASEKL